MESKVDVSSCSFDVYGYRFQIRCESSAAMAALANDFAFFRAPEAEPGVQVEILDQDPDYDSLGAGIATVYTPRNASYKAGTLTYIDYNGKALGVHNRQTGGFRVSTRDPDLQYEVVYLFLLSQIAEYLDGRRMHRVHALAVAIRGRALLALLPMGGGKSTLGAGLLRFPEVNFLSDDSPFVDRKGNIHAFPLRLGLSPTNAEAIPEAHRRTVSRMEFGPKVLVQYSYYADRVCPFAEPGIVFLGRRTTSRECRIEIAGTMTGLKSMMSNCVVGMGLFQGMEFVFHQGAWELAGKSMAAASRLRNSLNLLRRSHVCWLLLGRDLERNAATVMEYAQKTLFG